MTRSLHHPLRAALALLLVLPVTMHGQFDEYGVKAAFVRNFLPFVEWPAERVPPGEPFLLCVYNGSPITAKLNALTFDPIRGHRVQIRTMSAVPDLGVCHAVFVPQSESAQVRNIQGRYKGGGVLTITEDVADRTGAAINMYVANSRMTFDVDIAAADAAGVRISSKLLALAKRVHGAPTTSGAAPPSR